MFGNANRVNAMNGHFGNVAGNQSNTYRILAAGATSVMPAYAFN